jgi:hypothetical protein
LDVYSFFGQYFDGWKILIGLIVFAIAGAVLFFASKGKNDSSKKLGVRLIVSILIVIGTYTILYTIVAIGSDQATTIALIVALICAAWMIGAEGWVATLVGFILVFILALVISVNVRILPPSSPVAQLVTTIADGGKHMFETITNQAPAP